MKFIIFAALALPLSFNAYSAKLVPQVCKVTVLQTSVATFCTFSSDSKTFYKFDDFDPHHGEKVQLAKVNAAQFLLSKGYVPYGDGTYFMKK